MRQLMNWLLAALAIVWLTQPAWAASQENKQKLAEYFTGLGVVHYELIAPLGGAEVGGAVVATEGGARLCIAGVRDGRVESLISESLDSAEVAPPFTFLLIGAHALVYVTHDQQAVGGERQRVGDLVVYELISATAPNKLFEIKDVADLQFQAGSAKSTDNLLWQSAPHFLNGNGLLPVKYNYCRLSYDAENNEYHLFQHLTALPDAATVEAANLNNRAIVHYRQGNLLGASELLTRADGIASADQSVITRNHALITSEIEDLGDQGRMFADQPADEALQYYWQGDYAGVLRVMEARSHYGLTDLDYAMVGLSLARLKRWPEVDRITVELERVGAPFLADYLWELTKIAYAHGFYDVAATRLLALEAIDARHPGHAVGHSRLLRVMGEMQPGEQVLARYLLDPANQTRDLSEPRLELYNLYYKHADVSRCDQLMQDALRGPVTNLLAYVRLLDYVDLSSALTDVPLDDTGRIPAPEHPLETFGVN